MCNTYATPVTRTTVGKFCPGFSAFAVSPPFDVHRNLPKYRISYILFCGILIVGQEISPISFIR
ncbi:MAG: hypothetical protein ABSG53_01355 [Thermoguttaceae bacterium]|jgi:hypothetical protein